MFSITITLIFTTAAFCYEIEPWESKIVGGIPVDIKHFPYQISILWKGYHMCGGSILTSTHIVTAAHCTDQKSPNSLSIRVGSSLLNSGGDRISVSKIIQHPHYDEDTITNDISILVLAKNITNPITRTISLPEDGEEVTAGTISVVTGWGHLQQNGRLSKQLQAAELPIIGIEDCNKAYHPRKIYNTMICAGYLNEGGRDTCQGDSGGPLMARGKLFGIVSFGYGCADPLYPGVYTNVSAFKSFIKKHVEL